MKTKSKTKPVKANYEVRIVGFASVLVMRAENPEKAREYALDELSSGDFQIEETTTSEPLDEEATGHIRAHADAVAEDPENEE
jgi:hypothetical protein